MKYEWVCLYKVSGDQEYVLYIGDSPMIQAEIHVTNYRVYLAEYLSKKPPLDQNELLRMPLKEVMQYLETLIRMEGEL